jgi:hypothetical protein
MRQVRTDAGRRRAMQRARRLWTRHLVHFEQHVPETGKRRRDVLGRPTVPQRSLVLQRDVYRPTGHDRCSMRFVQGFRMRMDEESHLPDQYGPVHFHRVALGGLVLRNDDDPVDNVLEPRRLHQWHMRGRTGRSFTLRSGRWARLRVAGYLFQQQDLHDANRCWHLRVGPTSFSRTQDYFLPRKDQPGSGFRKIAQEAILKRCGLPIKRSAASSVSTCSILFTWLLGEGRARRG